MNKDESHCQRQLPVFLLTVVNIVVYGLSPHLDLHGLARIRAISITLDPLAALLINSDPMYIVLIIS